MGVTFRGNHRTTVIQNEDFKQSVRACSIMTFLFLDIAGLCFKHVTTLPLEISLLVMKATKTVESYSLILTDN